jgi:hypothetical protein
MVVVGVFVCLFVCVYLCLGVHMFVCLGLPMFGKNPIRQSGKGPNRTGLEIERMAQDRIEWHQFVSALCASGHDED